jgi:hypothetical protein
MDSWRKWDDASEPVVFEMDFYLERDAASQVAAAAAAGGGARPRLLGAAAAGDSDGLERVHARLFLQPPLHSGHESLKALLRTAGLNPNYTPDESLPDHGNSPHLGHFLRAR